MLGAALARTDVSSLTTADAHLSTRKNCSDKPGPPHPFWDALELKFEIHSERTEKCS